MGFKKRNQYCRNRKGIPHTESSKLKISLSNKGNHNSPKNEFKKRHKHSEEMKKKIRIKTKEGMKKVIHHINGNHNDDRIENRMIMNGSDHAKLHYEQGDYPIFAHIKRGN